MKSFLILLIAFTILPFSQLQAQFPAPCDADKACVGLAYTPTVSSGSAQNYIDVQKTAGQMLGTTAMSVEFWINATKQAGSRVYLGGQWGPYTVNDDNFDGNNSWAVYITPADELVFELNGNGNNTGSTDNTIAKTSASSLYGSWKHLCFVFDGTTHEAIIYINAHEVARASNASSPLNTLRRPADPKYNLQLGSTSDIARFGNYRTFIGQMDEIRIWRRVLSSLEIYCNMERSLAGNENGLTLYYRCNDRTPDLCDATGNGYVGKMANMDACKASNRTITQKISTDLKSIVDDVKCVTDKSWQINVTDTSFQSCSNTYTFSITGKDARFFKVNPTSAVLAANTPVGVTISFSGNVTGAITAQLQIKSANRCAAQLNVDINLTRSTEIQLQKRSMTFDTLYAKCRSTPYYDSAIVICNNTGPTGTNTNRSITIQGGSMLRYPAVFQVLPPKNKSFPFTLAPGQCDTVWLRFNPTIDTTFAYADTLHILSNDACNGSGLIAVTAVIQEVFSIRDVSGKTRLTSLSFPSTCPGDISDSRGWNWYNLTRRNLIIDSIYIPKTIVTVGMPKVPPAYTLRPSATNGELQKYFRFKPLVPGLVNNDPIIFYAHLAGFNCQFVDTLKWQGRGLDNDVVFSTLAVDFGNVIVGKDSTISVTFTNKSTTDVMNISFYLKTGDVFLFTGTNSATLTPGQQKTINITFRPTQPIQYADELCLFEQRCYTTQCIPVRGRGVIEKFRFDPIVMTIKNVIACRDSISYVDIINESTVAQTLSKFALNSGPPQISSVDQNGAPFNLAGYSVTLQPGQKQRFYFRFNPNNLTQDIAITGYLEYYTSLTGDKWMVRLYGTSIVPRLYITPLTIYGTLEVGDTRRDSVTLENVSPVPIYVDTLIVPAGYKLISMNRTLPRVLQPRDSITAVVDFAPTVNGVYNSQIVAKGSQPCPLIETDGDLQGKTVIVQLDASLSIQNFSYVRPCDCITRDIPLVNNSFVNNMVIDSMWVDSNNVANGTPKLFSWTSHFYEVNGKVLPFTIPPRSTDTVHLTFCPRTPAESKNINCVARFNINAHGAGWGPNKYNCFLAGKRSLMFKPTVTVVNCGNIGVDNKSLPQRDTLAIPGLVDNPGQDTIQIDSITYLPDDRVFTHADSAGNAINFPVIIKPGGKPYPFRFYFKPRAPRQYIARAVLHYSKPCKDVDTTILLRGFGLAPAYGLQLTYDSKRSVTDTFRIVSCDTLHIPVYSSRAIPAPTVDVQFEAVYDTTKLMYIGGTSVYNPPTAKASLLGGTQVTVKDCRNADSLRPFCVMNFVPRTNTRFTTPINIDSIFFDTQEVLNFYLSAGGDNGVVVVDQAELKIQRPLLDFDSVRVLDCVVDSFLVANTGDVAITVDSILVLPRDVKYISSTPSRTTPLNPGESAVVVVQYCPRDYSSFDSLAFAFASMPCRLHDSLQLKGRGFVPIVPIQFSTDNVNYASPAPRGGTLGDTITIPMYLDRDFSTTYHNTTYWLQDMNFSVGARWNKYMLKYLSASSALGSRVSITQERYDSVTVHFQHVDSLRAGKLADLKFLILVPDTVQDDLVIVPDSVYTTDSLLFIKLLPTGAKTLVQTGAKCNTTTSRVNASSALLYQTIPNPSTNRVSFRFDIQEYVPALLQVYNSTGELVATLLDGSRKLDSGQHEIEWDVSHLPPGVYTYTLFAGIFSDKKQMVVVR